MGQHLSDAPRDIATLTFDLAVDGPLRRYGSSSSICTPSLNFVGIPVRKILRIYYVSISRPGDLDLWPLTLKLVRIISREVVNLSINFGVSRTFRSRLIGHHPSDATRDLATLTFNLGGHGACCWCGSSYSVCVPSLKFVGLPVRKILRTSRLTISRPGNLDLWPWNWCSLLGLPVRLSTFPPILVFLGRFNFRLDLSAITCRTRQVTLQPWPWTWFIRVLTSVLDLTIECMNEMTPRLARSSGHGSDHRIQPVVYMCAMKSELKHCRRSPDVLVFDRKFAMLHFMPR